MLPSLRALVPIEEQKNLTIIALGVDIELALREQNILFETGRGLRTTSHADALMKTEMIGRSILSDPSLSFLLYRGVPLAHVLMPVLQDYLLYPLYFIDILTTLIERHPECERIIVPPSTITVLETAGIMALLETSAAMDAARLIGKKYNIEILMVPTVESRTFSPQNYLVNARFYFTRRVFGWVLSLLNTFVTTFRRPQHIRVLVTDYWKHLSPLMKRLPESELMLLDRSEVLNAGFPAIWRNRVQFIHIEDFLSRQIKKEASVQAVRLLAEWQDVAHSNIAIQQAVFRGHALDSLLRTAIHHMFMVGGRRSMRVIEGSYALYERMRPDVVLVRASLSLQIHFPILCYVAKVFGIPSIEIQHGLLYLGPGTFINNPAPEYIATYGPLTSAGFKRFGYTNEQLLNTGSPRFDQYEILRKSVRDSSSSTKLFTIACIVPAVLPQSWSDTYEVEDYFRHIAAAVVDIPNIQIIFKLRPGAEYEAFYQRIITEQMRDVNFKIAQYESLIDVFAEADVVATIYSTTTLEGLISGRPVVYNGTLEMHAWLGREFEEYEQAGALMMATTPQRLKEIFEILAHDPQRGAELVANADAFMKKNYSFDGGAAQRLADDIRRLKARKDSEE